MTEKQQSSGAGQVQALLLAMIVAVGTLTIISHIGLSERLCLPLACWYVNMEQHNADLKVKSCLYPW